jgi:hypothetical protein
MRSTKRSRLLIVTLASHKPNFLELQFKNFKKVLGDDFTFLVLNNSQDSATYNKIKMICSDVGVTCIKVKRQLSLSFYRFRPVFRNGDYKDPSLGCSYGMNWFWRNILPKYTNFEYILFIDSDMFLLNKEIINQLLSDAALVTIEQFRGNRYEFSYPYAGFNIINTQFNSLIEKLNWNPAVIQNKRLDCGGASTHIYKELCDLNIVKKIFLFSLRSISSGSTRQIQFQVNGNLNGIANWDIESNRIRLVNVDDENILRLHFPQFSDKEIEVVIEKMLYNCVTQVNGNSWPHPIYIDFIFDLDNIDIPLVVHYKSGSNYQIWQDKEYNEKKTLALELMLDGIQPT